MAPVWTTPQGPNANAKILKTALETADTQGLEAADYDVGQISRYWAARDPATLARLELLLTLELAEYVADLAEGRRAPRQINPRLFPTAHDTEFDPAVLLEDCLAAKDLRLFLEREAPPAPQYRELRAKLAEYRALAARGGWPQVPAGPSLKPGATDTRVPAVRRRLIVTGELSRDEAGDKGTLYGEPLVSAVKTFQRHHGLRVDGIVGPATIAAMNVTAAGRVRQIILNMESWRWVMRNPGDRLLLVNIPSFELRVMRKSKTDLTMPVVVGEAYHMTPVFTDKIRYVEFNPYWYVPADIAVRELLPKLRQNSRALAAEHIRVFLGPATDGHEVAPATVDWAKITPEEMAYYSFRQDPGPANALGRMAFIFPNAYSVYLHDTPAKALFERTTRTFSHGCIRVAKPASLAVYLLGGGAAGWNVTRVGALTAEDKNRMVHLSRPMPIFILYNTTYVDPESHQIFFYNDVYGRDALLEKALF